MLKTLIKMQFSRYFSALGNKTKNGNQKSKGKIVLTVILYLYLFLVFGLMLGLFFGAIAAPFFGMGIDWLYYSFAVMLSFVISFLFTVFSVQSQLYEAKDNDLLLSMPIPAKTVLMSRIIYILILNYIFSLLVFIPAGIQHVRAVDATASTVAGYILTILFMPMFTTAFTAFIGWIVTLATQHMKRKNLISTIFLLAFMGLYFYFYSKLNTYMTAIITNGEVIAAKLKTSFYPVYWMGGAISHDGNLVYVLFIIAISVVSFALMYILLSHNFIKLATANRGVAKIKYKEKAMKVGSAGKALTKKEIMHLTSNPMLFTNEAMGLLFLLILPIAMIIKADTINAALTEFKMIENSFFLLFAFAVCIISSSILISAPSISLEGKNFWIVKTVPVNAFTVLNSKAMAQIVLEIPFILFADAVGAIVLKFSFIQAVLTIVITLLYGILTSYLGVVINLNHPKMDYQNDVAAVKQGVMTLISMFVLPVLVIIPGVIYYLALQRFMTAFVFSIILAVVYFILCMLTVRYLKTSGSLKFNKIE